MAVIALLAKVAAKLDLVCIRKTYRLFSMLIPEIEVQETGSVSSQ